MARPARPTSGLLLSGAVLIGALLLAAAAAPLLAPYDPDEQVDASVAHERPPGTVLAAIHLADGSWRLAESAVRTPAGLLVTRLGDRETLAPAAVLNLTATGVADHRRFLLGSDRFGRDVLSRVLYGARVSLAVSLIAVALAATLGLAVGSAAALGGPWIDAFLMRTVDALLAFPWLFLLILLAALFRPAGFFVVFFLSATSWMEVSRLARAEILSLKEREFVLAARAIGARPIAILWRHLLPNAFTPVLVQSTLLLGNLILIESSLSFLGLGIGPPTPSWGNMIADGSDVLATAWWVAVFPGAAIAVTVLAVNLLGEGLRDALDPRERARERRGSARW
ncbi:MAG: peptide/nickel transport system permease protein [Acidobacteriota bacterium]|jgi:peptide/nickel transport system permease protein|nr:peptide/nickel transport system permease protein [Acidobacteriota bacterium]